MIATPTLPSPGDFAELDEFVLTLSEVFNELNANGEDEAVTPERITDIDIEANQPMVLQTSRGKMISGPTIKRGEMEKITEAKVPEILRQRFNEKHGAFGRIRVDNEKADIGITRLHLWRADTGPVLSMRVQPFHPPNWAKLRAPGFFLECLRFKRQGMLWVTAPVRGGKTHTIHGGVEEINENGPERRVVVIGDPPEFSHKRKNCIVRNREIGFDTPSYQEALADALRSNPNILVASELRGDIETSRAFLEMGQLSCLAIAGMHVQTTYGALHRFINPFPERERDHVVSTLQEILLGIINQRVVPTIAGGEILATEVLIINDQTRGLLTKPRELRGAMQGKQDEGMWLLEDDLSLLATKHKVISEDTARLYANDPEFLTL